MCWAPREPQCPLVQLQCILPRLCHQSCAPMSCIGEQQQKKAVRGTIHDTILNETRSHV